MASSGWKGQTRGGTFGYRFFIWLIRTAGIRVSYAFLYLVVPYFVLFAPKAVKSIRSYARNLPAAGCASSWRMVFRNFNALGKVLIDKIAVNGGMSGRYSFCFENFDEARRIFDSGSGVIMIGAHVGNWEIGSPFFDRYGRKLNIVMFDNEHRKIKELLESNAIPHDYKIIPVNNDSLTHIFLITEALCRGEYVCFQGDRYTGQEKTIGGKLLGKEAMFPLGPFILASRLRTPVVFYTAMREKGMRYTFRFSVISKGGEKVSPEHILAQYTALLDEVLEKYPEQWFNYYDFWKQDAASGADAVSSKDTGKNRGADRQTYTGGNADTRN